MLTDRGTEYCGNPEHHEYELYLALEDIDHTRTKARSPQTNGIVERLHDQADMKGPGRKVCRGRIFSPRDYAVDVDQWGFSDAVGNLEEQYGE